MTLWTDARYVGLARDAASRLGASHDAVVAAILAQWACEIGDSAAWPPPLDNPGNLTSAIGTMDGEPHSVGRYIGGGAYLYRYASPDAGALGYANYLLASPRYRQAVALARSGDGRGFLAAVCNAGYGTRASCALGVLGRVVLPHPTPVPAPRWTCLADAVNVRNGPGTNYAVVGVEHRGAHVTGTVVTGGHYRAGAGIYSSWLRIGASRYTARAYYRQG